jgi:hypothetical protein
MTDKPTVTTSEEQVKLWVEGDPRHNSVRDECCPDFSCCDPSSLAPLEERQRFAAANDEDRHKMLMMFLGKTFASEKIYIAGDDANYRREE